MIIPTRITVGKITYDVVHVATLSPHRFGSIDTERKQIRIARGSVYGNYSPERRQETFLHELLHACMYDMGMRNHDEDFVNELAQRLLRAFDSAKL